MKAHFILVFHRIMMVIVSLAVMNTMQATTRVVRFGGSFGSNYSPSSFTAAVGDTVRWEGDFSAHPLSSTSVPAGAQSFHQGSGTLFLYPVTTAGTYNYLCDFHSSSGMTGSFTTIVTGIDNDRTSSRPGVFGLGQNFPNPFNPTTTVSFDIPFQTYVSLKVYNLVGQEVAAIVGEDMKAGSYSRIWNAASLPSGIYLYRLQAGSLVNTRKLVLLK